MSKYPKASPAAKRKYYASGGDHCPYCGSNNIEGGNFEVSSNEVWQPINCNDCGRRWDDVYRFKGMEEITDEWQAAYDEQDRRNGIT